MPGNNYSIEEQIKSLNQQYDLALEKGEEFSVLRKIKDKLKELRRQLHSENGQNGNRQMGHGQNGYDQKDLSKN